MNVSFSQAIACVTRPETKARIRSIVGAKVSRARSQTSPGLKMSRQESESVKRVNWSRMLW